MRGIILAAGRGSRLGDITDTKPKCLVELADRPLLDWQMRALRAAGVTELGAVHGYMGHRLKNRGLNLFANPRWQATNMVQSLVCADAWLASAPCVVSYSDIVYTPQVVEALLGATADIAITYDRHWLPLWAARFADPLSDAETFAVDDRGLVTDIGRKPTSLAEVRGQYMGLLRFTPAGWEQVCRLIATLAPADADRLDMTSLLRGLLTRGGAIEAIAVDGGWGEVDTPEDLALYENWIAAGEFLPHQAWE